MKFNQNASFNVKVRLNEGIVREDAIEHVVSEIRKFLKANAIDGNEFRITGNTYRINDDEDDDDF